MKQPLPAFGTMGFQEAFQVFSDELNRIHRRDRRQKTRPLRRASVKDPLT